MILTGGGGGKGICLLCAEGWEASRYLAEAEDSTIPVKRYR